MMGIGVCPCSWFQSPEVVSPTGHRGTLQGAQDGLGCPLEGRPCPGQEPASHRGGGGVGFHMEKASHTNFPLPAPHAWWVFRVTVKQPPPRQERGGPGRQNQADSDGWGCLRVHQQSHGRRPDEQNSQRKNTALVNPARLDLVRWGADCGRARRTVAAVG